MIEMSRAVGGSFLLFCGASLASAQHCWFATDASTKEGSEWPCKTFQWALRYKYTNSGSQTFGPYLAGWALIDGACLGDYRACSGQWVAASKIEGSKNFQYSIWNDGAQGSISMNWQISEPYRQMDPCPYGDGHIETVLYNSYFEGWAQEWCN